MTKGTGGCSKMALSDAPARRLGAGAWQRNVIAAGVKGAAKKRKNTSRIKLSEAASAMAKRNASSATG
jgi:hypothetical protein